MSKRVVNVIQQRKRAGLLIGLCFLTYACSYIGRLNYSAALTELIAGGILTKAQGGMISTVYFGAYGAGQMVNGMLADRHNPVRQVALGVGGSAGLNLLFAHCSTYGGMLVVWGLNGYFQSLIWAPAFLLLSQYLDRQFRPRAMLLINTAPSLGTIMAYLFSSLVLWKLPWKCLFVGAALMLFACAALWMAGCRSAFRDAVPESETEPGWQPVRNTVDLDKSTFRKTFLLCGAGMLVLPAMIHGMLKDGVTSWVPTYMTEMFHMPPQAAVAITIVLPVINTMGAAGAYLLMRRIPNETTAVGTLFLCAGTCLLFLQLLGTTSAVISVLLLAVVTAAMMGVNVILCSEVPLRFSLLGKSATVSGFFNACGYIGAAASMYGIAVLSERWGWTATQLVWIASCGVAAGLSLMIANRWMDFRRKKW